MCDISVAACVTGLIVNERPAAVLPLRAGERRLPTPVRVILKKKGVRRNTLFTFNNLKNIDFFFFFNLQVILNDIQFAKQTLKAMHQLSGGRAD